MVAQEINFFSLPSSQEWWRFILILGGLFLLIGAGEGVRLWRHWSPEFSRKLVHISVGVLIFFAPTLFTVPLPAVILALVFIVANAVAIRFRLFPGMHGTARATYGTVFYPLSFLILTLLFWFRAPYIISLAMLVLAFGDAAAAIVGESDPSPRTYVLTSDRKSLEGSWTMFAVSCLTLIAGTVHFFPGMSFTYVLASSASAALVATAWEAISSRGLDNLTIPLSVAFVLSVFLISDSGALARQFTIGIGLSLFIAVLAYSFRFLTAGGAVATFLLASVIYGIGGWKWTLPILVFFVLSSLLSRIGRLRKEAFDDVFEKTHQRDHGQVAANGAVAGMIALLSLFFPGHEWYPYYLAAVAAVTADTWGTELGLLSRGTTFLITSGKRVDAGTNGGVTIAGLIAAVAGAVVISTTSLMWNTGLSTVAFVALAGFSGSLFDSILGATVQGRFRCIVCGKITERLQHCDAPTAHIGGIRWIRNDFVNWMCALGAALLMPVFGSAR